MKIFFKLVHFEEELRSIGAYTIQIKSKAYIKRKKSLYICSFVTCIMAIRLAVLIVSFTN